MPQTSDRQPSLVDIERGDDGTLVVVPHGTVGAEHAGPLRRILVQAFRRERPSLVILDLADVAAVDPINLGTLIAAGEIAADQRVPIYYDNPPPILAGQLAAAGIPHQHVRTTDS
ncbi:STAS domain-containing protein [Catenuloplanes atrovinosus]|uniref:Anti-anti-sigma regulatory factor n=1 Tax=Catenuloplanes atrovinosus TaxID=137266 RepID=A0AAE4CAX5_9ACTN|nr:hypothetical protein [Catenuloplanes atrovinosus]MDR7278051.1 anti-anti-sigma regulatory factor [Catenuloplanes atrovinosus]